MAEPVDAAVALEPRPGVAAHPQSIAGPIRIDVGADARHEPVGKPGGTPRVVAPRQIVHERRERDTGLAGVCATDRVHDDVAVRQQEAAIAPRRLRDRLDRRPWIVTVLDHREDLARVAVPRVAGDDAVAALEMRRRQRRCGVLPDQDEEGRRAHPDGPHGHGEGKENAAAHGVSRS